MQTTLNILKAHRACGERYAHLVAALGGTSFDHDAPIDLLMILERNGADDTEWAISNGATITDCAPLLAAYNAQCAALGDAHEAQCAARWAALLAT